MPNTNATTIMLVDLSLDEARHSEFDDFYQGFYIPEFLRAVPQISSARRYAQTEGFPEGDLSKGHFLTVYELGSDEATESIEAAIARAAHKEASDKFKLWKDEGLTYFDRAFYKLICRHGRLPKGEPWENNSIYTLRWVEKADAPTSGEMFHWVEYFNREMFRVPKWLTCRTYLRMNSQPPAYLTVFEAPDQDSIIEALCGTDIDLDEEDQIAFAHWLQSGVDWHDCLMLKPIYFRSN